MVGAAALCVALLTGCADDDPEAADPSDPTSDASSTSPPTPPAGSASPTDGAPTVVPATGPRLSLDDVEIRLPEQWSVEHDLVGFERAATADDRTAAVFLSSFPALDPDMTVAQLARTTEEEDGYPPGSVQAETSLADRPAFHVAGRVAGTYTEEFGVMHDGNIVAVEFVLRHGPDAGLQELIDSVLATVQLR